MTRTGRDTGDVSLFRFQANQKVTDNLMSTQNTMSSSAQSSQSSPESPAWLTIIPGVLLTMLVAWAGVQASEWIGTALLGFEKSPVSGIMMAIIFGLIIGNVITLPEWVRPGVRFSLKIILKAGIILLGIRLSLGEVVRVGALGIPVILLCIVGAILIARWLSRRLGLSDRLSTLIAIGTSICGATAIVATGPAIEAKEEEITYAVANITLFGIIAMFLYPYLANALFPETALNAGLFLGTSIHETAQVAGSGLIYSQLFDNAEVLDVATVTKLVRNVLMALVIPMMAYLYRQNAETTGDEQRKINILNLFPMFILGFLGFALIRTVGDATVTGGAAFGIIAPADWTGLTDFIKSLAEALLAVAMAGVGLGTGLRQLRRLGLTPFYVGFVTAVAVAGLSLGGIALIQVLNPV